MPNVINDLELLVLILKLSSPFLDRCRIKLCVIDNNDSTTFVIFETEAKNLLEFACLDMCNKQERVNMCVCVCVCVCVYILYKFYLKAYF